MGNLLLTCPSLSWSPGIASAPTHIRMQSKIIFTQMQISMNTKPNISMQIYIYMTPKNISMQMQITNGKRYDNLWQPDNFEHNSWIVEIFENIAFPKQTKNIAMLHQLVCLANRLRIMLFLWPGWVFLSSGEFAFKVATPTQEKMSKIGKFISCLGFNCQHLYLDKYIRILFGNVVFHNEFLLRKLCRTI